MIWKNNPTQINFGDEMNLDGRLWYKCRPSSALFPRRNHLGSSKVGRSEELVLGGVQGMEEVGEDQGQQHQDVGDSLVDRSSCEETTRPLLQ